MTFTYYALVAAAVVSVATAGSVTDTLMQKLNTQGKSDAVLELPSVMSSVLSNPLVNMLSGSAKSDMMTGLMKQMTSNSQAPFLSALSKMGVKSQPFWITNKISMKGVDAGIVKSLAALPGAFNVRETFKVKLIDPVDGGNKSSFGAMADGLQWGVKKIGADQVWDKVNLENMVVANIDTGVAMDHEALADTYGGQWHDAIGQQDTPYDDGGHGTHTMGTICGTKNGIGVAPGAKWVACKGLGEQGGSDVTLSECAQWILSLEQKPVAVCNSWGGGQGQDFFNDEIKAWQAAGIIPVFAIGNEGPNCGSASSPGDQPNLISVGATTNRDQMARFSSRGKAKRSGLLKPEVSAPGQDVISAWPDGSYKSLSGTSMATPHVTGAVVLMKAANPDMTFKQILERLEKTADRPSVSSADLKCGTSGRNQQYPNNAFGYGRINVASAMK